MKHHSIFEYKTVDFAKLIPFGFTFDNGVYTYTVRLLNGQFSLTVTINADKRLNTTLIDTATQEEYTLHLVDSACGSFVGTVRAEYQAVLQKICDLCYQKEIFKSAYAHKVIAYIRTTFGDELEYLWAKSPDNAIARRKDNQKWYMAILTVSRRKLGLDSDEAVEILDLRVSPEELPSTVDDKRYFLGYHMNKKHWFTVCLDGSVPLEEIYRRIDKSYELAKK
ncbi:MAG: MmcQ/YjbR family DNA-binding protein [Clostridia bacterium]|nr:MmcQ/YjbR family DNA-binding protein [Clostridia bacterium]